MMRVSTTTIVCLCALSFFAGCFIQLLPEMPGMASSFKKTGGTPLRRRAAEIQSYIQPPLSNLTAELPPGLAAPGALQSITPGSSGNPFVTDQPFQLLSWYPRMYVFPGFIDDERCDHVVKIASDKLGPSGLAYRKTDDPTKSRDVRTSSGTFMSRHNDPAGVLAWVEEKIHAIMGIPVSHGEPFNVLRYQLGQHYDSHYDTFDPEEYGPQSSQRIATVLFYLTDVEEGGETVFPLEGPNGMEVLKHIDYRSCKDGYKYKPRKGDALMFYSVHPNGTFDKHALHGGCPVKKGLKMVMTKWIRDQCHGSCATPLV